MMAVVWSTVLAVIAGRCSSGRFGQSLVSSTVGRAGVRIRRGYQWDGVTAAMAFLSSALHFAADVLVHNGCLPLHPYSTARLGFSLWDRWGVWAWHFEVAWSAVFVAAAGFLFARRPSPSCSCCAFDRQAPARRELPLIGGLLNALRSRFPPFSAPMAFVLSMSLWVTPWTSPNKALALVPQAQLGAAVALSGLASCGSYAFAIAAVTWPIAIESDGCKKRECAALVGRLE